jgi:hypothetical protein
MRTALLALALAGCGGSPPPPSSPPVAATAAPGDAAVDANRLDTAAALARMGELADDMCKCADRGCIDRVTAQMTGWAQDTLARHTDEVAMTDAETRRMAEITEHLTTCVTELMTKTAGPGASP